MVWYWSSEVNKALKEALTEFEKSHSNVNVRLTYGPQTTYAEHTLNMLESGTLPDVLWVGYNMVASLRACITELDSFAADRPELIEGIPDEVLELFRYNRVLYGIPLGLRELFLLNAYAISSSTRKADLAVELILLLRSEFPPPS